MRRLITVFAALAILLSLGCSELEELESSVEVGELDKRAESDYKAGEYQAALDTWLEAFELAPDDDALAYDISRAYAALGNQDQAVDWLQRSFKLTLQPRLDDTDLAPLEENEEFLEVRKIAGYLWGGAVMLGDEPANQAAEISMEAFDLYLEGRYEESIEKYVTAFKLNQKEWRYPFNIACNYALLERPADCVEWLRKALHANTKEMTEDHDFDAVRASEEFRTLVEQLETVWGRG
jgi:tetratricopeptide (TPR) repeat protein